ncbi:MAG: DUF6288 domain-containing protein, partial [Planctomycetota bacterium]
DLARKWDGTFQHQGPPQARPDSYEGWDSTGAYLLAYAQPRRKIFLTGRTKPIVPQLTAEAANALIDDGRGWSPRQGLATFADRSDADVLAGLRSWSPVVRERSAVELARRGEQTIPKVIEMLDERDRHAQLGACQALAQFSGRAARAVPRLRSMLQANDLWVRVKSAEALAAIGDAATPSLPDLLSMLPERDLEADPRGMQQRYLCFVLFNQRGGLLGRSLDGVDRDLLRVAVEAGLRNEDGRARGSIGSVYRNLAYEELKPLFPVIFDAIVDPAPSGIMFADEIRLSGLDVLSEHHIEEALPWCVSLIDPGRWGADNRVERCLEYLRRYGGAAATQVLRLRALEDEFEEAGWDPDDVAELGITELIEAIESDDDPPTLAALSRI